MLNEADIRQTVRRRARVLLPTLIVMLLIIVLGGIAVNDHVRPVADRMAQQHGESAGDAIRFATAVAGGLGFLAVLLGAGWFACRSRVICPSCEADVSQKAPQLLATRCCPSCSERIVAGGRVRDPAVHRRRQSISIRAFARRILWVAPAMGVVALALAILGVQPLPECFAAVVMQALFAGLPAGWAWLRTRQSSWAPLFLVSMALVIIGGAMWWYG